VKKKDKKKMGEVLVKFFSENQGTKPEIKTDGSAGYDLAINEDIILEPYTIKKIHTGIYLEIPNEIYFEVLPRSSIFLKGIIISGLIDSDYTGECMIMANNTSNKELYFPKGTRLAQIVPRYKVPLKFIDGLKEDFKKTERGESGFGSTDSIL
jgi:dUTP pyrophosphatase